MRFFCPLFKVHDYKPTAVQNRFQPFKDPMTGEIRKDCGSYMTDVLLRCDCKQLKTKSLKGTWTLEQVKGGTV